MLYPALISSIFEVCITQPLDVIKTHQQTNTKIIYSFGKLYKGFLPRALGNIPSRSIFLISQDFLKEKMNNKYKFLLVPIKNKKFEYFLFFIAYKSRYIISTFLTVWFRLCTNFI